MKIIHIVKKRDSKGVIIIIKYVFYKKTEMLTVFC